MTIVTSFTSINLKLFNAGFFFCWLFLFVEISGTAQIVQDGRIEIPLRPLDTNNAYSVISAQTDGLVVLSHRSGASADQLEFVQLDTTLKEVYKGYIKIEKGRRIIHTEVLERIVYVVLRSQNTTSFQFEIVRLNLISKEANLFIVRNFIAFNPSVFLITSEAVMIGGYFNYRPFVLRYLFAGDRSTVLPGLSNEKGELLQLKGYEDGTFDVLVSAQNMDSRKCIWIRRYDQDATILRTTILEPEKDKNLIFGRSVKTIGEEQVVAGVYGKNSFSRGIFVANINPYGEYGIKYYNFADLENFFRYMKAKKLERVKKRIERKKVRGKNIKFNYRLIVHELIPYRDEYILLGEALYPTYRQSNIASQPSFANSRIPMSSNQYVFDGYQYTHAIVIGFSKTGKLLWDNSFEINDIKSFKAEQFVKIQPAENHIDLLYLFENTIRSKTIKDSEVLEGKTLEAIKMYFPSDHATGKSFGPNKLEYWYPGHFFAVGVQEIENSREAGISYTRKVFFINKITGK